MEAEVKPDEQKIKRYLYGEMTDAERRAMEEEFFEDDELFIEIAEIENLLVDRYVRQKIHGAELRRFEEGLEKFPARRARIANAGALQSLIAEERAAEEMSAAALSSPPSPAPSLRQKIAALFSLKTPASAFTMASLLFLLALTSLLLFIDNRSKSGEIADLQRNRPPDDWEQKRKELEDRLAAVSGRTEDLQKQSEDQSAEGDRVFGELESVNAEKERLERELETLKREKPANSPKPPVSPTIASFLLTPLISSRDGSGSGRLTRNLSISREVRQISMRLALPDDYKKEDRLSVKLNGKIILSDLQAQKSLQIKVLPEAVADGLNKITVVNGDGQETGQYIFNMRKK